MRYADSTDPMSFLSVRRLRLEPGDTLVLETPRKLTMDQVQRVVAKVESLGLGESTVLFDDGLHVAGVIARDEYTQESGSVFVDPDDVVKMFSLPVDVVD